MEDDDSRYYEVRLNEKSLVKVRDLTEASMREVLDSAPVAEVISEKAKVLVMALFNRAVKRGNFKLVGD